MTTESSASDSACSSGVDRGRSSVASRLKLRKLTTAATQQTVNLSTHYSSPSEYFASNARINDGKLFDTRKGADRCVPNTSNAESSPRNDGPSLVASAKRTRPRRKKCQSTEATQGTAKRNVCKKRVESEVSLTTELDASSSAHLQPSCLAVQNYNDNETHSFARDASKDNNSSSSSDVEWEDVEGSYKLLPIADPNICSSFSCLTESLFKLMTVYTFITFLHLIAFSCDVSRTVT